ncbi:hypothetical protein MJG53_001515 [Ovis ammon polii x Ovis aries]|uniref:Uncharacterized protein n=1 Tax=Ovis ammon polii x Ovis aries TaxID=2918886 RepID=A0ACB9VLY9_9CETA|nr:hypothetical protein MJG53_001515 [Ovis ammon polii x Ovis aries]
MGNCLYRVADDNSTKLAFKEENWSEFSEDYYPDYNETDVEAAAPCHSCPLLDYSSLPFFILVSVLGILASGTVLYALLRPLFRWQLYQDRPTLVQLAVGSALFSIVVPILARGLSGALITSLCHLAQLVAYSSAFAQALLIGRSPALPKLPFLPIFGAVSEYKDTLGRYMQSSLDANYVWVHTFKADTVTRNARFYPEVTKNQVISMYSVSMYKSFKSLITCPSPNNDLGYPGRKRNWEINQCDTE